MITKKLSIVLILSLLANTAYANVWTPVLVERLAQAKRGVLRVGDGRARAWLLSLAAANVARTTVARDQ
jgi:hypothetical protein